MPRIFQVGVQTENLASGTFCRRLFAVLSCVMAGASPSLADVTKLDAIYECQDAFRDPFVTHTSIDGNLITGQNQNTGYETAHRILEKMAKQRDA